MPIPSLNHKIGFLGPHQTELV